MIQKNSSTIFARIPRFDEFRSKIDSEHTPPRNCRSIKTTKARWRVPKFCLCHTRVPRWRDIKGEQNWKPFHEVFAVRFKTNKEPCKYNVVTCGIMGCRFSGRYLFYRCAAVEPVTRCICLSIWGRPAFLETLLLLISVGQLHRRHAAVFSYREQHSWIFVANGGWYSTKRRTNWNRRQSYGSVVEVLDTWRWYGGLLRQFMVIC